MSLNWSNVKSLAIPVGGTARDVKRVSIGGAVVWEKPSPLPYDAEVEYLESTGTQYINTGITGGSNTKIEITAASTNTTRNAALIGSRNASAQNAFVIWQRVSQVQMRFDYYGSTTSTVIAAGVWDTTTTNIIVKDGPANEVNGVAKNSNATSTFTCDFPFFLFGLNAGGSVNSAFVGKFYACKIYANSVLVRDYIPVRVGTVGYLYDRVSGKLFGNAGTGDFIVGPDVVPVEYIESHGTEYINSGFDITNAQSFAYDVKFSIAQSVSNAQPRLMSNEGAGAGNYYDIYFTNNVLRARQANVAVNNAQRDTPIVAKMTEQGRYYGYYESTPDALLWDATRTFTSPTVKMDYRIFGRGNDAQTQYRWQGKAWYMRFWKDGVPLRFFLPVRIGTNATQWEGAMMDVLTRRIYRNAGTGAFGYGNDLPQ